VRAHVIVRNPTTSAATASPSRVTTAMAASARGSGRLPTQRRWVQSKVVRGRSLLQRQSQCDGGWSREGKIRFPRQHGVEEDHSIDRTGRFQGMLQLARKRIRGRRAEAEVVLVALDNAIERTARQLRRIKPSGGDPRAEANALCWRRLKRLSQRDRRSG
jgi:hypothetical protein